MVNICCCWYGGVVDPNEGPLSLENINFHKKCNTTTGILPREQRYVDKNCRNTTNWEMSFVPLKNNEIYIHLAYLNCWCRSKFENVGMNYTQIEQISAKKVQQYHNVKK